MIKIIFKLVILLLLVSGCQENEIIQLDLKGTIKGTVKTSDEFFRFNNDEENVVVRLIGSEEVYAVTDINGEFEITDIPAGTYNLKPEKEGYSEYEIKGLSIVGGERPLYFNLTLIEKSSIVIEISSLEIIDNNKLLIKGIIYHNYLINDGRSYPRIMFDIYDHKNPASSNWLTGGNYTANIESGSQFEFAMYIYDDLFPSGSKIYVVAYGGSSTSQHIIYDPILDQYISLGLGEPSNIATITIP